MPQQTDSTASEQTITQVQQEIEKGERSDLKDLKEDVMKSPQIQIEKIEKLNSSSASLRAFSTTYTSEDIRGLKSYLHKRAVKDDQRGQFRLSKAMKWYLLYIVIFSGGLYMYFVYPKMIATLLTLNTWIVAIILLMNYGLTIASYMLSSWPSSKTNPVMADGDIVLAWFGRALVILHFGLFLVDMFSDSTSTNGFVEKFLNKAALNTPHIIPAILGFPRRAGSRGSAAGRVVLQHIGFFFRLIAQIGTSAAILFVIQIFGGIHTYIISLIIPIVPYAIFLFFYFRARIFNKILPASKKSRFILFGERAIREPMFFVATSGFVIWMICFVVLQFMFKGLVTPQGNSLTGDIDILTFLWICSLTGLLTFGLPATYHCMYDIQEKQGVVTNYRLGKQTNFRNLMAFCNVCYMDEDDDKSGAANEYVKSPQIGLPSDPSDNDQAIQEVHINMNVKDVPSKKKGIRSDYMNEVSLVIACHLSEVNIKPTLNAALSARFAHQNIFVAHNGGSLAPPDNTGGVVRSNPAYDGVQYVYLPEGNKTIAVNWVIQHMVKTQYVCIIDDDVTIPSNVDMEGAYHQLEYTPEMKAIAFTIRGVDTPNLVQVFQHIEYMQAGFNKIFQAQFGSVLTCHGAIALWRTDTVRDVFQEHNTEFNGEDLQMGLILRRMNKNYTIGVNAVEPVPTTAPKSLFYEPTKNEKSLFVQRIFSWDVAAHHFLGDFFEIMVLNWERNSIILKPFLLLELWTQLQDWLRFVFIATMIQMDTTHGIFVLLLLLCIQFCLVIVFDRIVLSNRPEVQSSMWILMLYPIYNIIIVLFRFGGLMVNVLYYTPWSPPRINIVDREDRGELPPKILGEYDVPKNLRDFYWKNVWKTPSDTYKRVAHKVKGDQSRFAQQQQAQKQQLKYKHMDKLNLSSSAAIEPPTPRIAQTPVLSSQRQTPVIKAEKSEKAEKAPGIQLDQQQLTQLLPLQKLQITHIQQIQEQLNQIQQMQLTAPAGGNGSGKGEDSGNPFEDGGFSKGDGGYSKGGQYGGGSQYNDVYGSHYDSQYGSSYGGGAWQYGGPSNYKGGYEKSGYEGYGGAGGYGGSSKGYDAGYGGEDQYAQMSSRGPFTTSRPRSSSFGHYRYGKEQQATAGGNGWRRGQVARNRG